MSQTKPLSRRLCFPKNIVHTTARNKDGLILSEFAPFNQATLASLSWLVTLHSIINNIMICSRLTGIPANLNLLG